METTLTAIEVTGTITGQQQLQLDEPLPMPMPKRVRVILLYSPMDESDEDENEWLTAATRNPAFDFLKDPEEDIYTPLDGKPFHDEV